MSFSRKSLSSWSAIKKPIHSALVTGVALLAVFAGSTLASAASSPVSYTPEPFTPANVSLWTQDRTLPTGGVSSTSYAGRTDVLEMSFVGADASLVPFYQTEGIQRDIPDSDSIKADVYIDPAWGTQTVRAGLWGVGHDSSAQVSSYPIIEYSTDPANPSGWRYWDVDHWVALPTIPVKVGAGDTLSITHDSTANTFVYRINGNQVASSSDEGSVTIGAVILNSKNYGQDYAAHWSNFAYGDVVDGPTTIEQCKKGNWSSYTNPTFKNQGECVSWVQHNVNGNGDTYLPNY